MSTIVEFVFPTNRKTLVTDVEQGVSPDNGLYGFNYLKAHQFSASFHDVSKTLERVVELPFFFLHRLFHEQIDVGFQIGRALLLLPRLNQADVIVTNTDSIGLPVCLLKRLGFVRKPTAYAVGLFYIQGAMEKATAKKKETLFLKFYKWLLSGADHIVYHSPIEREKLVKIGIYNPATCTFVAMGSDERFFQKRSNSEFRIQNSEVILSVGRDHARDYKTLFQAAQMLSGYQFVVLCSQRNIEGLLIPKNVKVFFDVSYREVREWYRRASVVVIPMKEMYRSSGQMTLTDSFQAGLPIITTNVVGIAHYGLQHGRDALLVSPENVLALTKAIRRVIEDKKLHKELRVSARRLATRFTTRRYAVAVANALQEATDSMRLRPAEWKDLEFLRVLRNQNRQFFYDDQYVSKKTQQQWFRSYVGKQKKGKDYMFILEDHRRSIGASAIYNINGKNRTAEIGRFIIDQRWRGKGYGKTLLEKIEHVGFGELGMETLTLGVLEENQAALLLYRQAHYRQHKLVRVNGKKVVMMSKTNILQSLHAPRK